MLRLNNYPIQSVTKVQQNGADITDFELIPQYAKVGMLYRGNGWNGNYYVRGMANDVVSGEFSIKVTYIAGYYLPSETGYTEGAESSLPYDIVTACIIGVAERYNIRNSGADGIKAHSEGGISTTFNGSEGSNGLSASVISMLEDYKEIGIA
ncbi:MAG: hypothetical protein MJ179_02600 [Treponema sp.]|nr:hypothetical protein [Treponema sp.]